MGTLVLSECLAGGVGNTLKMVRSLLLPCVLLCLVVSCYAPFPRNDPRSILNPFIVPWWCKGPKFMRQVLHLLVVKEELNERGPCSAEIPPDRVLGEPEPEGGAEPEPEPRAGKKKTAKLHYKAKPLQYAKAEPEPEAEGVAIEPRKSSSRTYFISSEG